MTVYFRSPDLVITERLIRVEVPRGWQVWVIADLRDFGVVRHPPPVGRRSWRIRRPASCQLWATRGGTPILIFERPDREFDAACRALRRVLERLEDAGNG